MDIIKKIKERRKELKISQKQVAEIIGISQAGYAKIEKIKDGKSISIKNGISIAKALNISFNELFDIEKPVNPEEVDLTNENMRLKKELALKEELSELYKEKNELLKPYRQAYIQELAIGETMVIVTEKKVRETIENALVERGVKPELLKEIKYNITSAELRQEAIKHLKKEYPHLDFDSFYYPTLNEIKNKI
ncbi:helix-turn-helix transcriptional regulator [Draconibacterium sp.]|nr:helix-turn-helix transcriptional regulator [Draconibacterium sp.]